MRSARGRRSSHRRRGRRPGGGPAPRDAILAAAASLVARRGLRAATVRAVAARARVDPALIYHYFPDKDRLLLEALKQAFVPFRPPVGARGPDFSGLGEKIVFRFLQQWGSGPRRKAPIVGVLRASAEDPRVAAQFREYISRAIVPAVRADLGRDAARRVGLVGGLLLGVAVLRYVLEAEPLASLSDRGVARLAGPIVSSILESGRREPGGIAPAGAN